MIAVNDTEAVAETIVRSDNPMFVAGFTRQYIRHRRARGR